MQTLQQYILVIGAFQGGLLFLLLITDSRVSSASRYLALLCLFWALFLCLPFIIGAGPQSPWFWSVGWVFYLPASIGGIAYLYARSSILSEKFSAVQLIHFAPLLACYLLVGDYIVFAPEKLAGWIDGGSYTSRRLVLSEYLLFAHAIFYIPMTIRLIARYRVQANSNFANFNPDTFRWLAFFMALLLSVWVLKAIFAFWNAVPALIYYGSDIPIVALIYTIAAVQWRHPQLFTIPAHGEEKLSAALKGDAIESDGQGGILDPETRADLLKLVKETVEATELFRDSDLTLSRLANEAGLKSHHLSEVLNQEAGQNFYQFINAYRIEFVCSKFKEDAKSRILDTALDAGFASKSTFNSIFKQFKGVTPSQYRASLRNEG